MKARAKFLTGSGIIVVTLVSLAYVGFTQSKTYYHTISELGMLHGAALHDTFKDGAQALVEGRLTPDGRFNAEQVQAKCASKYEATPNQTPGTAQPGRT